jgi:hypothetical protein
MEFMCGGGVGTDAPPQPFDPVRISLIGGS